MTSLKTINRGLRAVHNMYAADAETYGVCLWCITRKEWGLKMRRNTRWSVTIGDSGHTVLGQADDPRLERAYRRALRRARKALARKTV